MVTAMHSYGPFALFTCCSFVAVIWVWFAFPECKGRSMESMDALFTLPWWKVGRWQKKHEIPAVTSVEAERGIKEGVVSVGDLEGANAGFAAWGEKDADEKTRVGSVDEKARKGSESGDSVPSHGKEVQEPKAS